MNRFSIPLSLFKSICAGEEALDTFNGTDSAELFNLKAKRRQVEFMKQNRNFEIFQRFKVKNFTWKPSSAFRHAALNQ